MTRLTGACRGARSPIATAIFCCLTASGASAANLDYRLSAGTGYSDNVTRVPTNEVDEQIAMGGVRFALDQQSARLDADVVGDVAYYDYLDDTYDSEVVGNVYADTAFSIVPERFIWALTDQFGQVLTDPFLPATAENRENINYFTTGPDFYVGLGTQTRLQLGGRYAITSYEDSDFDSTSTQGHVGLIRLLSDRSSVSLNGEARRLEYDDAALNADFDETEAYLRYAVAGARTNLSIDVGFTQIDRDAAEDSDDGLLLRLDISRRLSPSSIISLSGGREFSTAASEFAGDQGIVDTGLTTVHGIQSADPFTLDDATLDYSFRRNRTALGFYASWSDRSYEQSPVLDQKIVTYGARYSRELSQRTSLEVGASFAQVDYEPPNPDYDDMTADVTFAWRLSQTVTMELTYDYADRSGNVAATDYTENRIWLTIGYGRGEPRVTRTAPRFGVDALIQPAGN